jgi:excisionase family DNA binding protein
MTRQWPSCQHRSRSLETADDKAGTTSVKADRLHDLDTIAERLGVASKTLRRMITRGELGYYQVGRLKRISESQYLEYLSRVKRGPLPR